MNKTILFYLVACIASFLITLPLILPYFHNGYFPTHDGEWAVVRLSDMYRELRDGQFPARYSGNLNFGYGYPLFNFAYPLPYYLGVFIHFFHIGFVDTIKLLFAVSVPLSFFFMFLASRKIWKSTIAGAISAILYVFLPYRMVDLYVRGSLGESLAFVFFPALLFFLLVLADNAQSKFGKLSVALLFAALLMTHNIMALYFGIILLVYLLVLYIAKKYDVLQTTFLSLLFGLGISAFFWIPSLFEKKDILLSKIPIADRSLYFVSPFDLIIPKWGYGAPPAPDGFSYQLGIALVIMTILLAIEVFFIFWKQRFSTNFSFLIFFAFLLTSFILILNMFSYTSFLWYLPLFSDINYPWTLLLPISFLLSLCTGFIIKKPSLFRIIGIFACVVGFLFAIYYARPFEYVDRGDNFYLTNDATTTSSNEYTPLWVKTLPSQRPDEKVVMLDKEGKISVETSTSKKIVFHVELLKNSRVQINTIYYPGWKITINDQPTEISYTNNMGVMQINVPKGTNRIVANFTETPLRLMSDSISLISLFGIFIYSFISQKKLFHQSKKILL